MVTGGLVALWASFQISTLNIAEDVIGEWDSLSDSFEEQRDRYSAIRVAGLIALVIGAIVAVYGFILLKRDSTVLEFAAPVATTVPGAVNFCEYCGRQLSAGAVRCPSCGRTFQHKAKEVAGEQEVR